MVQFPVNSKEILESFWFCIYLGSITYLAFVGVRSADTHLQPNLYHTLGGNTFHLSWVKAPVSQGIPALLIDNFTT